MDTRTGEQTQPRPGEEPPTLEQVREDLDRAGVPDEERAALVPPVVKVPPTFLPLTPSQRLAAMFGTIRGKDRSRASKAPKGAKSRRRRQRKQHRQARRRNR